MTEINDKMREASWVNGEAKVLVPGQFKGALTTMVRVVLFGSDRENEHRPQYGYQLSKIIEGGPVLIHEDDKFWGPAMGAWPDPEEVALMVLDMLAIDPEEIGDDYGAGWSDALREWNENDSYGLDLIRYDYNATQCGNACRQEEQDGRFVTVENHMLTDLQALAFVTKHHGLTWLSEDPREWLDDDDRAAIAALEAFWDIHSDA